MHKSPLLPQFKDYFLRNTFDVVSVSSISKPAAVLIAITDDDHNPCLILTKRAEHLNSHRGEVCFPGGKWEAQDTSLTETALRESLEEIHLPPAQVQLLGAFKPFQTYLGVNVMPVVGVISDNQALLANPNELDAVFKVPVSFFLQDHRVRTDVFDRNVGHAWSPAYVYQGFEVWGFTAWMIVELLNHVFGVNIGVEHEAPVRHYPTVI